MEFDFERTASSSHHIINILRGTNAYDDEQYIILELVSRLLKESQQDRDVPPLLALAQLMLMSNPPAFRMNRRNWLLVNQAYALGAETIPKVYSSKGWYEVFNSRTTMVDLLDSMNDDYNFIFSRPVHAFIHYHDALVRLSNETDNNLRHQVGTTLDKMINGLLDQLGKITESQKEWESSSVHSNRRHLIIGATFALSVFLRMVQGDLD